MTLTQTQEPPLTDDEIARLDEKRQAIINAIPQYEVESIFRRHHLHREVVIGLIGLRGDGKSGTGASFSLVDEMFEGRPVWSNMQIRCDIGIDKETARKYGLKHGGVAHYESLPLDKDALMKFDERYKGGCIFLDEINVEFSHVYRFMSNRNINFNRVVQELRKYQTDLIYTVIDEMFIDGQLRKLTDIFFKCEDVALSEMGLAHKKQPGEDFRLIPYPMSGYMVGREKSYYNTGKPLPSVIFPFRRFRGIYDDKQFQGEGLEKYGADFIGEDDLELSVKPDFETLRYRKEWGWLNNLATEMVDEAVANETHYVLAENYYYHPEVERRNISKRLLTEQLKANFNIKSKTLRRNGELKTYYFIPFSDRVIS